jgi:Sulfotransferase domain/N-terminal domain of galactosyltransferase
MPRIVFCTTVKNRTQHLSMTLPKNIEDNETYDDCRFIILDYNSQDNLSSYLFSRHKKDIASGRLVVYSMLPGPNGPVPFKMAHAKNMAHRCGILEGADILVNLDADGYTGFGFAQFIHRKFSENSGIFLQAMWNRYVGDEWLAEDPRGEMGPPVPKGSNGRMVVSKNAFILAGGYDEKYETWGPDDKQFNVRLRRLGFTPQLLERTFQDTVLHNDRMRFKEYPEAAVLKNSNEFDIRVGDSCESIANFGNVGCGTVYCNFDFNTRIDLSPIPTRIFGVGMHKTATTSLAAALKILGHNSAHWESAHWAKAIWDEMIADGKSPTLERSYALSDLPITILYKELDVAYPNSKFILTIRDEDKWLDSVRRHWDKELNPFRLQWDNDPFSHFIHKQIYGRRDFDPETFLERYRRHNAEVAEYFKSRPKDLLIFKSNKWNCLCNFLKQPIPYVDYPKRNGYTI